MLEVVSGNKERDSNDFSKDKDIIRQVQQSQDGRINGCIYNREQGLEYLKGW